MYSWTFSMYGRYSVTNMGFSNKIYNVGFFPSSFLLWYMGFFRLTYAYIYKYWKHSNRDNENKLKSYFQNLQFTCVSEHVVLATLHLSFLLRLGFASFHKSMLFPITFFFFWRESGSCCFLVILEAHTFFLERSLSLILRRRRFCLIDWKSSQHAIRRNRYGGKW